MKTKTDKDKKSLKVRQLQTRLENDVLTDEMKGELLKMYETKISELEELAELIKQFL